MCHCLKVFHSKTFIECLSFEEDNWQNTSACCSFFASGKSLVVKYLRTWQQHSWNILTFVFQRFLVIIEHSFFQKSYSISLFVKLYNKCSALKGAPPTEVELSTSVMSTYTYIPWRGEEGSKSSSSLWIPTLYNVKYKYSHCISMYICICDVVCTTNNTYVTQFSISFGYKKNTVTILQKCLSSFYILFALL